MTQKKLDDSLACDDGTEHFMRYYLETEGPKAGHLSVEPTETSIEPDGRILSREEYPDLFEAIRYAFGHHAPGEFRIPDLRSKMEED